MLYYHFLNVPLQHCIKGKMAYSPLLIRLSCDAFPERPTGKWETVGYGIFGIYKSDWDKFGGMNVEKYRSKWGGEDWDLLDRVLMAGYEVERLKVPHFNHIYHSKKGMWHTFEQFKTAALQGNADLQES